MNPDLGIFLAEANGLGSKFTFFDVPFFEIYGTDVGIYTSPATLDGSMLGHQGSLDAAFDYDRGFLKTFLNTLPIALRRQILGALEVNPGPSRISLPAPIILQVVTVSIDDEVTDAHGTFRPLVIESAEM